MSKYQIVRTAVADALAAAGAQNVSPDELYETFIVVAVEGLAKSAGGKRAADALRYELQNVGGDVDTVFLRSR
jgi:hypothetical protein